MVGALVSFGGLLVGLAWQQASRESEVAQTMEEGAPLPATSAPVVSSSGQPSPGAGQTDSVLAAGESADGEGDASDPEGAPEPMSPLEAESPLEADSLGERQFAAVTDRAATMPVSEGEAADGDGFLGLPETIHEVQLGAFLIQENSIGLAEELVSMGYAAYVVPTPDVGSAAGARRPILYTVRIGEWTTRSQARKAAQEFRERESREAWARYRRRPAAALNAPVAYSQASPLAGDSSQAASDLGPPTTR